MDIAVGNGKFYRWSSNSVTNIRYEYDVKSLFGATVYAVILVYGDRRGILAVSSNRYLLIGPSDFVGTINACDTR